MNRGARGFDDVISLLGNAKKIFAAAELKGVSVDLSDLRRLKNIGLIDDSAIE
ncbi:MAG: hypothetical protein LBO09_01240 [Candidatus Peribacteria bacterium]|nr:hypothetical protein [Candidatus Peribacteria bacterium]